MAKRTGGLAVTRPIRTCSPEISVSSPASVALKYQSNDVGQAQEQDHSHFVPANATLLIGAMALASLRYQRLFKMP